MAAQLLRAGTSVGANAEEAKAAHNLAQSSVLDPLLKEADELVAIYTAVVRRARLPIKG
jgi:hypothetical protein